MALMGLGVLVGYLSIRSLLMKAITIAKDNRKALEPFLSPETVKELNQGENELSVLSQYLYRRHQTIGSQHQRIKKEK